MISESSKINMIKQQLRTGDVINESILCLFDQFPREDFVPSSMRPFAYSDMQIPLEHGQCMLTPLEEGTIIQSLNLQGHETVLEIGTGTGFFTSLLASQAKHVTSVDYYASFTKLASENLKRAGIDNIELLTGDAYTGWMDSAPYDVIVFTGAIEQISESHKLQTMPGGKLFAIVGKKPIMQGQLHQLSETGDWTHTLIFETCVPPLVNKFSSNEFNF